MVYSNFLLFLVCVIITFGSTMAYSDYTNYCVGPYCPSQSFPDRFENSDIPCNITKEHYFKNPADCHSYYFCSGNTENATKLICPNEYGYHGRWKVCVPEVEVRSCGTVSCPAYIYDGVIPDPKDCRRFYSCQYGFTQHEKCPRMTTFDAESGRCKFYKRGNEPACLKKPDQPVTTTASTFTTTATADSTTTTSPATSSSVPISQ